MRLKIYFLLLLTIILSCQNPTSPPKPDYRKMNFTELFPYFISVTDSVEERGIAEMLKDSIVHYQDSLGDYPLEYSFTEKVDTVKQEIKPFFFFTIDEYTEYKLRNSCRIFIDEKNAFLLNENVVKSTYGLEEEYQNFILNPRDNAFLPQKKEKVLKDVGRVHVSRGFFGFQSSIIPDSLGNHTSLIILKVEINRTLRAIHSIRDSFAMRFYGRKYDALNFAQKRIISQIQPYHSILNFDNSFPPPLPSSIPPPPPLEFDELIEEFDDGELKDQ